MEFILKGNISPFQDKLAKSDNPWQCPGIIMMKYFFRLIPVIILLFSAVSCNYGAVNPSPEPGTTAPPTISTPSAPGPTATPPAPAPLPVPGFSPYTVNIAPEAVIGNYLVDNRGMTLYYTVSDRPGYSNLPDEILSSWPVFSVPTVVVPPTLNTSDFATYSRDNNVNQTTYKGYPLYYFSQDKAPGDTLGNKAGGVWFIVNPANFPP